MKDIFDTVYKEIELLRDSIQSEQSDAAAANEDFNDTCDTTISDLRDTEATAKDDFENSSLEDLTADAARLDDEITALEDRILRN